MTCLESVDVKEAALWNQQIERLPGAHALQTWHWGQVKARFGWRPHALLWRDDSGKVSAAALVLQRRISNDFLSRRLSVMYAPRGPLLDWTNAALVRQVLEDLGDFARKKGAIFIKIDPDLPIGLGVPGEDGAESDPCGQTVEKILKEHGWQFSGEQIQFRNTVMVDLCQDEVEILMRMKSKTRYNIRLAERRGVSIRVGNVQDIDLLYQMYAHTALRDDFVIRNKTYYETVWRVFFTAGLAEPLIAEVDGKAVGAVVLFRFAGRAWFIYGMSLDEHREKMFNYLLQWEAIRRAKAAGCFAYDMWGAPDVFKEDDPLWGVFRFKDGFGGQVVRTLGAWDFPARSLIYRLYNQILTAILGWMRKRGKSATKRSMST